MAVLGGNMQIHRAINQSSYRITKIDDNGIYVNDELVKGACVLSQDILELTRWETSNDLTVQSLTQFIEYGHPVWLLGTGKRCEFPPVQLISELRELGVGLEVMDNFSAARTYEVLSSEGRKVMAIFLPM